MKLWKLLSASLIIFVIPVFADACGRCGFNYCRGCSHAIKTVVQQQPVLYPQQVINISNVYPQGTTAYQASYPQLYGGNPDIAVKAAELTVSQGQSNLQAAIQYGQNSNLAIAQIEQKRLAVEHARAFTSSEQGLSNLTLNINQSGGALKPLQTEQIKQNTSTEGGGFLRSRCGSCHGSQLAQPKAGLVLSLDAQIPANKALRSLDIIRGNNVPSAMKAVIEKLTPEDKAGLMNELLNASLGQSNEPPASPEPPQENGDY